MQTSVAPMKNTRRQSKSQNGEKSSVEKRLMIKKARRNKNLAKWKSL